MNFKLNEDDIYDEFINEKNYNLLNSALGGDFNFKKIFHKRGPELKGKQTTLEFYDLLEGRTNLLYFIEITGKSLQQIGFYHKKHLSSQANNIINNFDKDSFILEFDTNKVFFSKIGQYDQESFSTYIDYFLRISKKSKKGCKGIVLTKDGYFSYDQAYSYKMESSHCGLNCSDNYITDFIVYQIEENFYLK